MKKLILVTYLILNCFFSVNPTFFAQQVHRHVAISAYLYNFAKNVRWPNEDSINGFHFLIIGKDEKIIKEVKTMSKTKTLRDKPIKVSTSEVLKDIDGLHLIFVTKGNEDKIVEIFDKIEGKNILLVTDSHPDKQIVMINFYDTETGTLQFEINKANIINQKLSVMHDMILLGGTEIDVAALYREGQQSLRSLQRHTENLEKNLMELEKAVLARNVEVENNKDSLRRQSIKIEEQQRILDNQSLLLGQRDSELADQVKRIQQQQLILDAQTSDLDEQNTELEKGSKLLEQQKEDIKRQKVQISQQEEILKEQGQKIHKQRNLVYLLIIIIVLAVILAFSILNAYRTKQRLNKELEKRVDERTNDLNVLNSKLQIELNERMQAESSLRISEEKYRFLFERNPASLIIYAPASLNLLAVNESFCKHYGYLTEEALSLTLPDLFPPEEKNPTTELAQSKDGHNYVGEWHHLKKDGTVFPIIATSHDIVYLDKKARIAVITDITERKQAEKQLMESENKYRTLLENLPQKIFFKNSDLVYVSCNENFAKELNITSSEIAGKTDYDFFSKEIAEKYRKEDSDFLASGKFMETEECLNINGQSRWSQIIKVPVKDENDAIIGVQGIFWNITDRKLAEEELKRTNEELISINRLISTSASVLETKEMLDRVLTEVLAIVGLEGGTICTIEPDNTFKIVAYKEVSAETITTLTENRIPVGQCLCGSCARDHCPLVLPDRYAIQKYSLMDTMHNEDLQFHAAFPCTIKEKCVGVVCIFTRTDKKPSERNLKLLETLTSQVALSIENAQLVEKIKAYALELEERVAERTAQLVSINKELESFSYSISHDLRAPLRAIFGFSQILARRHRPSLNEEGQQYMDYIVEASIRMEQLINDLLNYSRLGRKSLDLRPISLKAVVDNIYLEFKQKLEEVGASFVFDTELPQIRGDESLLRQIFTNLIENAITYRRAEVPLKINISCEHNTEGTVLKISDNGIGIPKEYCEKIFNIFQRLHSEDKYPGTGIGLATVRKAASMLNGTVRVESEVGAGSKFIISFAENKNITQNG